jgi:hypothetical protein
MTTENGVEEPRLIRGRIKLLTKRRDYLAEKLAGWVENNGTDWDFTHTWTYQEILALDYAIKVMEVEFDSSLRIYRTLKAFDRKLELAESNGGTVRALNWVS